MVLEDLLAFFGADEVLLPYLAGGDLQEQSLNQW